MKIRKYNYRINDLLRSIKSDKDIVYFGNIKANAEFISKEIDDLLKNLSIYEPLHPRLVNHQPR